MLRQANILLAILVSFLLAFLMRFGPVGLPQDYLLALLVTLVIAAIVLPATGAYRLEFEWAVMRRMRRLIAGWAVVLMLLVSLAAMLKITDTYSRIWFGLWTIFSTLGLVAIVLITHFDAIRQRRKNRKTNKVVLVGAGDAAARVERRILEDPASDMELLECFGEPWSESPVRPLSELPRFLEENRVYAVWVATPWEDKDLLYRALEALRESVVDVHVVPDLEQYRLLNQNISEWSGLPVISLAATPMTDAERRLKQVFDWLAALLVVVVTLPFTLLIALLIKLTSKGPVFYRQQRHGMRGEQIGIYKFRTMRYVEPGSDEFRQATQDDDRVTAVGRFLRKTSLDELPQLINVLKGEMSLVGPRPHPVQLNDQYMSRIPKYMMRHKVKPGMTGWAQVNGFRGLTDTREKMALRIEHDLWYIQNWSLWLDLRILAMTPFAMVHRNAY
jgi:putative colanic acid biosynthesis UDP-glucose lipid carrier transferase